MYLLTFLSESIFKHMGWQAADCKLTKKLRRHLGHMSKLFGTKFNRLICAKYTNMLNFQTRHRVGD